ncbi:MAG: cytochrome c3 family protein [Acidobacteriota bacterium]
MSKLNFLLFLGGIVSLTLIATFLFGLGSSGAKQPLEFNHKIHAENGLDCVDCHQHFKEHSASGRPSLEICSDCHSEPLGKSETEKALQQYILKGEEIPWKRLYRVPEDVYFSHKRHVVIGGLECKSCHGDIGERAKPPSRPLIKITMKRCMDCHEEKAVANDCIACHR